MITDWQGDGELREDAFQVTKSATVCVECDLLRLNNSV
jgi:hypothetical protein